MIRHKYITKCFCETEVPLTTFHKENCFFFFRYYCESCLETCMKNKKMFLKCSKLLM